MQDKPGYPKVLILEKRFPCYNTVHKMGSKVGDKVVLVNTSEVIPIMASIPQGKLITIREICQQIAHKHGVQGCCSLTTGIFTMTIANAVVEAKAKGEVSSLTQIPYWRTLKADGYLNEKFPGGQEAHKALLQAEGFLVIARGKKYQVKDFENALMVI